MNKLVTVIVPTIGRPKYIKSAVESILLQDYPEIEILISDNFPKISTSSVLGNMRDSRIKFVVRDRRLESSEHMNLCIKEARGDFIMILSDDDLISTNYISSMMNLFCANKDVIVGLGRQKVLSEEDLNIETNVSAEDPVVFEGIEFTRDHFRGKLRLPIYTYFSLFAKKADVISAGGFKAYPDGSNADNFLFYSLALKGKVGISSGWMGYRVYLKSSGLSTSFEKLYLSTLAYDRDMSCQAWGLESKPLFGRIQLRLLIKISTARMMVRRLFKIYKARIGALATVINLARVLIVYLPSNIFSGFGYVNKLK